MKLLLLLVAQALGAVAALALMPLAALGAFYAVTDALTAAPGPLQLGAVLLAALAMRPPAPEPEPARPDGRLDYPAMLAYAMHLAAAPQPVVVHDYDALCVHADVQLLARLLAEGV
jgi:hypothetical protein